MPSAYDRREQALGSLWYATFAALFLAVAVPWFGRLAEIPIGKICWLLLATTLAQVVSRHAPGTVGPAVAAALRWLRGLSGVAVCIAVWHLAGGIHNPGLLLTLLPILSAAAAFQGRRMGFGLACAASAGATCVALSESSELSWYWKRLGIPTDLVPFQLDSASPFAAEAASAAAMTAYLFAFFLSAFLSVALGHAGAKTLQRWVRSEAAAPDSTHLRNILFESFDRAPEPRVIVESDSGALIHANEAFRMKMLTPRPAPGDTLFQRVRFDAPERLATWMQEARNGRHAMRYRVGVEPREAILQLEAHRVDEVQVTSIVFLDEEIADRAEQTWQARHG